jgi:hypothetical protein
MAFMPSKDQLPQSLTTYLTKWLEVATKGNVFLHSHMIGASQSMTIFKCKCGQNWHVGDHLFYPNASNPSQEFIPTELQDWVKEHRHVCKAYVNSNAGIQGPCATCKWPYGAHEESWLTKEQLESAAGQFYTNKLRQEQLESQMKQLKQKQTLCDHQNSLKHTMPDGSIWTLCPRCGISEGGIKYKISYGVGYGPSGPLAPEPEKPKPIPPLPEPKGRKFR